MANWSNLKSAIAEVIKTNNNQEITGQILQNVLNSIVNNVGGNATFAGIAKSSTNPGNPDGPVFYVAGPGSYVNFSGITVPSGTIGFLSNATGEWVLSTIPVGDTEELLKVIRGTSENSSAETDPFISLGNFSGGDVWAQLKNKLDTLIINEDADTHKYAGVCRAQINGARLEITNYPLDYAAEESFQLISGCVTSEDGTNLSRGDLNFLYRTHNATDGWSEWQQLFSTSGGGGGTTNVVNSLENGLASSDMFNRILQKDIYKYSNVAPDGADHYDQLASHLVEWCPEGVPIMRQYETNDGNNGGYRQGLALVWRSKAGLFKSFFCMEAADKDSSIGRAFFLHFTFGEGGYGGWNYAGYNELKGGDADVEEQLQELANMINDVNTKAVQAAPNSCFDGFVESANVQQTSASTWSRIVFVRSSKQFAAQNGLSYYFSWNVKPGDDAHGERNAYGIKGKTYLNTGDGKLYVLDEDGNLVAVSEESSTPASFGEKDLSELDYTPSVENSKEAKFYYVTTTYQSNKVAVGIVYEFSDNMRHVLTQAMLTHYSGADLSAHTDGQLHLLFRSYGFPGSPYSVGKWSEWKDAFVDPSAVNSAVERFNYLNSFSFAGTLNENVIGKVPIEKNGNKAYPVRNGVILPGGENKYRLKMMYAFPYVEIDNTIQFSLLFPNGESVVSNVDLGNSTSAGSGRLLDGGTYRYYETEFTYTLDGDIDEGGNFYAKMTGNSNEVDVLALSIELVKESSSTPSTDETAVFEMGNAVNINNATKIEKSSSGTESSITIGAVKSGEIIPMNGYLTLVACYDNTDGEAGVYLTGDDEDRNNQTLIAQDRLPSGTRAVIKLTAYHSKLPKPIMAGGNLYFVHTHSSASSVTLHWAVLYESDEYGNPRRRGGSLRQYIETFPCVDSSVKFSSDAILTDHIRYNERTGMFEMNGVVDLSWDDVLLIVSETPTKGVSSNSALSTTGIQGRTNVLAYKGQSVIAFENFYVVNAEVIARENMLGYPSSGYLNRSPMVKIILGMFNMHYKGSDNRDSLGTGLENVKIYDPRFATAFNFKSSNISYDSLKYFIDTKTQNESAYTACTITVTEAIYNKLTGGTIENWGALATLASGKNITLLAKGDSGYPYLTEPFYRSYIGLYNKINSATNGSTIYIHTQDKEKITSSQQDNWGTLVTLAAEKNITFAQAE